MDQYLNLLCQVPLFRNITSEDIRSLLTCLSANKKQYQKHEFIFHAGDAISSVGIILKGKIQIVSEDFAGNRMILTELPEGELFAETFSCAKVDRIPVSVVAVQDCEILFVNYRKIIQTCPSSCGFHGTLIENMLGILAYKNMELNSKIDCLSKRSTRDKLLSYLGGEARRNGSNHFTIPFNRQELADYLCVDRSAMSGELGKLKNEGKIRFNRSLFELI